MENPVIIIGAGGLGKAALDIFSSNDVVVYGFLDDNAELKGEVIGEIAILGTSDDDQFLNIIGKSCEAFIAVDDNRYRKKMIKILNDDRKVQPVNAVHIRSYIAPSASIGHGNFVNAGASIGAAAKVGNHCIINSNVVIDYTAQLGDFVQIGVGSMINPGVVIENEAFIGSGVTIVPGVRIGKGARIGAGSVVVTEVGEGETFFGNPAKKIEV